MNEKFKNCPHCKLVTLDSTFCAHCGEPMDAPVLRWKQVLKFFLNVSLYLRLAVSAGLFFAAYDAFYTKANDFYTTLKFSVCFVATFLIYAAIKTKNYGWIVVFLFYLIVFNPFYGFGIQKATWQNINAIAAFGFLGSIFFLRENQNSRAV